VESFLLEQVIPDIASGDLTEKDINDDKRIGLAEALVMLGKIAGL